MPAAETTVGFMTQDVDPAVVAEAGRVYGRVYDAAGAAVHKLAGVLKGSAGMGGTDNAGHGWCLKYDALVGGALAAPA